MVLSISEAEEYNNGNLSKLTFKKVMHSAGFEKYLFRYCKIVKDNKPSEIERETSFVLFGYKITVFQYKGETEKINFQK